MELNQATLLVIDVAASIRFYRTMSFELIVEEPHYARFRSTVDETTFSVHAIGEISGPSQTVVYFECQSLDEEVVVLKVKGVEFFRSRMLSPGCDGGTHARSLRQQDLPTMPGRTGWPRHGE
ncbi:MAG: hypothetical protein U0236_01350 [Nitrospira sp.]